MGVELLVLERLDGEVVHPDRLHHDLDQVLRRLPRDGHVIIHEVFALQQVPVRVSGLQQQPDRPGDLRGFEVGPAHVFLHVGQVHDPGRAHTAREVERFHRPSAGDEVHPGVHVGARMGGQIPAAHGARIAPVDVGYELPGRGAVARPHDGSRAHRRGYVDDLHHLSSGSLFGLVAVGVPEDVYDAGPGLEPGGVLFAGGDVVGVAGFVDGCLSLYGQLQTPGDDDAPLGAVGVRWHLELLVGAEEDRLAVRAGEQPAFEPPKRRVHLGEVVHPVRKRVHYKLLSRRLHPRSRRNYTDRLRGADIGGSMERLEGKRAIVTGAGAGIGRAIALRLASEGATLVRRTDVTRAEEVEALVRSVVEEWGGLDVMVNNAGIGVAATAPDTSEEDFDRQMDVNLKGTFFGIKYSVPAMRDSGGGSIVNISSVAALVGVQDRAAYCAAKGGILALTRAAAIDHVEEGIRVNCIAPGTVQTPWIERITAGYDDPEEARARMQARQPHGRLVQAEEIAAMAAYLASDESASVIGACMVVDGGMTAR